MTTSQPVALVTGANSGLGKFAARGLLDAGYRVVGTSRNTAGLQHDQGVTFIELDVTQDESVTAAVDAVIAQFGRIDVLVNNAGMGLAGASEENSIAQSQRLFDINVFGVMRMTNAVLPHMRTQGSGRIVNISSIFGLMPAPSGPRVAAVVSAAGPCWAHPVRGWGAGPVRSVVPAGGYSVGLRPGGAPSGVGDGLWVFADDHRDDAAQSPVRGPVVWALAADPEVGLCSAGVGVGQRVRRR